MPQPIQVLLFGAGNRGADSYEPFALTPADQIKIVAVAEPNPYKLKIHLTLL